MKKEQISPDFLARLEADGFSVQAILAEIREEDPFGETMRKVRLQTGYCYSKKEIKRALNGREKTAEISPEVNSVLEWLKSQRRRRWILEADEKQGNENLLVKDLTEFSRGKSTDFIVWNCLAFGWQQGPGREFPPCKIAGNIDTSIVLYNRSRLTEIANQLAKLGSPEITVIVPSSEATDERIWAYLQSRDEREQILDRSVNDLNDRLAQLLDIQGVSVKAKRWDSYLRDLGIDKTPKQYTEEGEQFLLKSKDINRILAEATRNGEEYFARFGIEVDPTYITSFRRRYYGMYIGEGAAMRDIRKSGKNVVLVNFEDFRVPRLTLMGAEGQLSVVTPISDKEMTNYYQWEAEQSKIINTGDLTL